MEDLKNSIVCVCAKEDKNILVNEFVAHEETLREKFALIKGERDTLYGIIENLKKASLNLEESNSLLE